MGNFVVLDLEWNQPETPEKAKRRETRLLGEIIQIGAVKTDETLGDMETFEIPVKTYYYKELTPRLKELLPITESDFANGVPFTDAVTEFRKWCGNGTKLFSWSDCDQQMLRSNMRWHGNESRFFDHIIDVQYIFQQQITHSSKQISLEDASAMVGETPLEAHDALCDAMTTLNIMRHLDMKKGITQYDDYRAKIDAVQFEPTIYRSRAEALQDPALTDFKCPVCRRRLSGTGWHNQKTDKKITIVDCPDCGRYFIRVHFRRLHEGAIYTTRLIYPLTAEMEELYQRNGTASQ